MEWGLRPAVLVLDAVFIAASVAGIVSERRAVQLGAAGASFTFQLIYTFKELGVRGRW